MERSIEINGVELYFSVTDVDFMVKLEKQEDIVLKKWANMDSDDDNELLRLQFEAGQEFFNKVFGKGTADKLFEKRDMGLVLEAYAAIAAKAEEQSCSHIDLLKKTISFADDEPDIKKQ